MLNSYAAQDMSLVFQKEYQIVHAAQAVPYLGTVSLQGCYGISLYHPQCSAMIHWDDNCRHDELDRIVQQFLGDDLSLSQCQVNVSGGWPDHQESKKTGEFIVNYFKAQAVPITFKGFQEHNSSAPKQDKLGGVGIAGLLLNTQNGKIEIDRDWSIIYDPQKYKKITLSMGDDFAQRQATQLFLDHTHLQNDTYSGSGTSLMEKGNLAKVQVKEALALCIAARDNHKSKLIELLDKGITSVNTRANGQWTPLHFACHFKNFELAKLLISHDANVALKNNKGKTPLDLVKEPAQKESLQLLWQIAQTNKASNGLSTLALYSRHRDRLEDKFKQQIEPVIAMLETQIGRNTLKQALSPTCR